ncbi:serine hydrolase [Pleurocapsales cyanobacterium LEGE 06147]|nr:serine hydrolase [Pleurocapsales cyanobacterium LEGE 06147]
MSQRQNKRTSKHLFLKQWSKRFIAALMGFILLVSLSTLPSAARDVPQFPILDNRFLEVPPSETPATPSPTAPGLNDPQEFANFADNFFTKQLANSNIPGAAISVVKDGKIFFAKGYGYANLEKKIPVDANRTLFRVASLSKLFTATATMQLYEKGLINLDDDVSQYLEFQLENPYPEPVTFARLMMHTDGTTQRLIGLAAPTETKMKPLGEYLPEHMPPIVYPPGTLYSYSNHSIALLGYLVEKISGLPFIEYIDENILQPLSMERSTFLQPPPPELADDLAVGYQVRGGKLRPVPYLYLNIAPAAALSATATDMAHFAIAHLQLGSYRNRQILQPETARLMHQTHFTVHPLLPGTGYGFRERLVNNIRAIGHLGSLRGYSSVLTLIPEHNIGIFIATNSFNGLHDRFFARFFDRYFPKQEEYKPPQSFPVTRERLARFSGTYRDLEYPRSTIAKLSGPFKHIRITNEPDGTLLVRTPSLFFLGKVENRRLVPTEEPFLFRRVEDESFAFFRLDEEGKVAYAFNPMYPKIGAYERVPWYEKIGFHLGILAFCVVFFLAAFIVWLVLPLIRRFRGKTFWQQSQLSQVRFLAGSVGTLNLVFLVGLPLYLWFFGVWKLIYGVPSLAVVFFCLPLLTTILTVGLLIFTVLVWQKQYWSVSERSHYTLFTLAALAFIPFLIYWNLLGFQF